MKFDSADPWAGWEGERRLWVTLGNSAQPLVLAVAALKPDVITPIVTSDSIETIEAAKGFLDHLEDDDIDPEMLASWDDPVEITPDDLELNMKLLGSVPPGHLVINGGTTAMSAAAVYTLSRHDDARLWNVADRLGMVLSMDGLRVPIPVLDVSLEAHLRGSGSGFEVKSETVRHSCTIRPSSSPMDSIDTAFPFDGVTNGDANVIADLAGLIGKIITGEDPQIWQTDAREWLMKTTQAVDGRRRDNRTENMKSGRLTGELLEWAIFTFITRGLAQELQTQAGHSASASVYLGVEYRRVKGGRVHDVGIETDVVVTHGPRLTLLSVGADEKRGPLTLKASEAKENVMRLGGGESRSCALVMRTGGKRPKSPMQVKKQADSHRKDIGIDVAHGADRHPLRYIPELLDLDPTDLGSATASTLRALVDPMSVPGAPEWFRWLLYPGF